MSARGLRLPTVVVGFVIAVGLVGVLLSTVGVRAVVGELTAVDRGVFCMELLNRSCNG